MQSKLVLWLLCFPLCAQDAAIPATAEQAAELRALVSKAPRLALELAEFAIHPPGAGWAVEMVSSVAVDSKGIIYLLQRGAKADPVIAVSREGRVLRSWGAGMYKIPHSIRIDPAGNVWTVDAASSLVLKFTPEGKKLLEIQVGGQPASKDGFRGTTDIAFGPGGRLFISDGYGNARILEYTAEGKRVREWGTAGIGPGQFHVPHAIAIDENRVLYVADRENGRIQRFDLNGRYLGGWSNLGKTFSLKISGGALYIGTQPRNEPNGAKGWLMKVDRKSGKILGYVESAGHHSVEILANGNLMTGSRPDRVLWFR
ncbi:MAG: peptidyl-alpha-hydroxyglycine alpha-amidating lyase family protein [Bryobacteraceae bacterium]